MLLGEQAASNPALHGSNPCTVARRRVHEEEGFRVQERSRDSVPTFLNPEPLTLNPSSPSLECAGLARDRAKVEDQVRFLAGTLEKCSGSECSVFRSVAEQIL